MPNPEYQRLLRCSADELRGRLPGDGDDAGCDRRRSSPNSTTTPWSGRSATSAATTWTRCGRPTQQIDDTRPTIIIAYTIKGYGLPTQGHPQNHSSLLTDEQFDELSANLGQGPRRSPGVASTPGPRPASYAAATAERLQRDRSTPTRRRLPVPTDLGRVPPGVSTTQAALGRALLDLTREAPEVAKRVVTVSPDVSSTTNLAGWLNKVGVWSPAERRNWFDDDGETIMHWREKPTGQHMELGIAETNLVGLIGELGATWSRWGQPLFPIGVLYDPFVERALEPWSYGIYAGGQSILVGTPSGVSLAAEGGAHQSIKTPSIGLEQPGCTSYEPAFAIEVEWTLLDCISRLGRPDGRSSYLRLSTRPVRQDVGRRYPPTRPPGNAAAATSLPAPTRCGRARRRGVTMVAMGAMVTEALEAADRLAQIGIRAEVVCVTSPGLLFEAVQSRDGLGDAPSWILDQVFPADRAAPMVDRARRASAHPVFPRLRSIGCRASRWESASSGKSGHSMRCIATTASTPTASCARCSTWTT